MHTHAHTQGRGKLFKCDITSSKAKLLGASKSRKSAKFSSRGILSKLSCYLTKRTIISTTARYIFS